MGLLALWPTTPHNPASGGSIAQGYGLAAPLLPVVSRSASTITTSIPATSAASPQPEVLGASHMLVRCVTTEGDASELALVPTAFVAVTVKVYSVF